MWNKKYKAMILEELKQKMPKTSFTATQWIEEFEN